MNKILLLGSRGQVGQELQRSLKPLGELICCDRTQVDLNDLEALEAFIQQISPTHIVNAAAYTQVDLAESESEKAHRINAQAPEVMAKAAAASDAWLVHYSTDYVFDGTKSEPYLESDEPNPLNVYGKSKLAGEEAIRASGCQHLILRTSWVYSPHGKNFVKTILRLAETQDSLNIVCDQMGAPTSASLIAETTAQILQKPHMGTFHLTAQGETSWLGFAECIIELSHLTTKICGIPSEQYPLPAKRPANSRLSSRALCERFDLELPDWERDFRGFFEKGE